MNEQTSHLIVAYYHLVSISDPHLEVKKHKTFFKDRDATMRIYVSETGINCQMSATAEVANEYMQWMNERPEFGNIKYKIDPYFENVFPRQTIKYRRQLVAFDFEVDLSQRGQHLSPKQWKEMLDKKEDHLLLDIRNDYEWDVGRFEGSDRPPCQTSRGFQKFAEELKNRIDPENTPIMMYCTGGIRCEFFSAWLKKDGFKNVYQLDGGVINYGHEEGSKHWEGQLYVFDDRMTVPISPEKTKVVGQCRHCGCANESYYNCANTDCNELFISCKECIPKFNGCCQNTCMTAERVRPYQQQGPHKPFKRIPKSPQHINT